MALSMTRPSGEHVEIQQPFLDYGGCPICDGLALLTPVLFGRILVPFVAQLERNEAERTDVDARCLVLALKIRMPGIAPLLARVHGDNGAWDIVHARHRSVMILAEPAIRHRAAVSLALSTTRSMGALRSISSPLALCRQGRVDELPGSPAEGSVSKFCTQRRATTSC